MAKTPTHPFRSISSESDLQKPNSSKPELLEEIRCAKKRRSDNYKLSQTGLKEYPSRSIRSESDLLKLNSSKSEIPFSKKAKTMNNNSSNSDKLAVITSRSESDLKKRNPALYELTQVVLAKSRRSDECKLAEAEKFISGSKKPINSDEINFDDGLSYLGKFLFLRKMNFVDEDRYPGLAKIDQALRCGMSFNTQEFTKQFLILNTCPVTHEKYLFDLDVFPPPRFETYFRGNPEDKHTILLAQSALEQFNRSANTPTTYKFTQVVKVVCMEKTHFITFQAKDNHSGICKNFQTKAAFYYPNSVKVSYVREKLENDNSGLSVVVAGQPDTDEIK